MASSRKKKPHQGQLAATAPIATPPAEPTLESVIRNGPQFTVFAVGYHNDDPLYDETLKKRDLYDIFMRAGAKDLFLEGTGKGLNFLKQALRLEPEDIRDFAQEGRRQYGFGDMMMDKLAMVAAAKEAGMTVHMPDHDNGFDRSLAKDPIYKCYQNSWFKRALTTEKGLSVGESRERLAQDDTLALRIKKIAGDKKAIVMWGAGHAYTKNGLDQELGRNEGKAQVVLAHSTPGEKLVPLAASLSAETLGLSHEDKPDFYYNSTTRKISTSFPELEKELADSKKYDGKWLGSFCKP